MPAVITFTWLHPVLLTITGVVAVMVAWGAPASCRGRRWWPFASLGLGMLGAVTTAALGLVPWLGTLHLALYSVCMLGGFLLAWLLMRGRAAVIGLSGQHLIDCLVIAIVLGVIGARARYVYERWDRILADAGGDVHRALVVAADLDRGGAVWYGGAVLAALGILLYLRWRRIPLLPATDLMIPAMLAGLGIGRIGCWFNGCCYGAPTTVPWGVTCTHYPGQLVHPTQLYESAVCLMLGALTWWAWRHRRSDGQVTVLGLLGYGIWRFINESLRGDHDAFALGGLLTTSQMTSLLVVAGALALAGGLWWWRRGHPAAALTAARVPGSCVARVPDAGNKRLPSP